MRLHINVLKQALLIVHVKHGYVCMGPMISDASEFMILKKCSPYYFSVVTIHILQYQIIIKTFLLKAPIKKYEAFIMKNMYKNPAKPLALLDQTAKACH